MPARVMTEREGDAAGGDEVKFEELFNDRDDAFAVRSSRDVINVDIVTAWITRI